MSPSKIVFVLMSGVLAGSALAQNPPVPVPPGGGTRLPQGNHPRREPCWQVAGVSKSTMEQVRSIRQQARQEIEGVCTNSSLSAQQKHEQIREIHQKEKQQVEGLISSQQHQALRACQAERGKGGHAHPGGGHGGGGPCKEMTGPKTKTPQREPDLEE